MAGRLASRSFAKVAATVSGREVHGFWEGDDPLMVEEHADAGTPQVGADGDVIFSDSANVSAIVTLRLQESSPTHAYLQSLYDRRVANGIAPAFPFTFVDTVSSEGGSAEACKIMNRPTVGIGTNATQREWKIFAAKMQWNKITFEG